MRRANALHNSNKLKLGLFSLNADGGIAITKVPERWQAGWPEIAEVAKMVDRAGFEFILPIARWKGFGGERDVRTLCYETFTFAAALLAMTEQITIFSTGMCRWCIRCSRRKRWSRSTMSAAAAPG
jgi:FMNH2-dependent dimethyl sulfone monooxygenase